MSNSSLSRLSYYLGLPHPKLAILLPVTFLIGGFALAYFLPRFVDPHVPGDAPVVQIILGVIWFSLMWGGFFELRGRFRKKYGDKAYRQLALRFFLPSGILMVNGIVRALWIPGFPLIPLWLRIVFGFYFLAVGILLEIKGVKAMGIDRVAFVYVVFPERGKLVESALYQFLRHPLYAAMIHMCFGFAFFKATPGAFLCALIFALKLWVWSYFEERELAQRFGLDYLNYRKRVPAFIPKLRSTHLLLQALLGKL